MFIYRREAVDNINLGKIIETIISNDILLTKIRKQNPSENLKVWKAIVRNWQFFTANLNRGIKFHKSLFKVSPNQKFINNLNGGIENMVIKFLGTTKLGIVASILEDWIRTQNNIGKLEKL